jgi:effector-binding domain-containing protein
MPYICKLSSIDPQPAIMIRSRASAEDLPEIFETSFTRLVAYLETTGEDISGPPFAIYHDMLSEDPDVEMCLPITKTVSSKGDITCREIAIENAASTVHTGPYEEIESAYIALAEWTNENGYEPTGEIYEFYLNDPGTTSPEDLQTVIFMPLKSMETSDRPVDTVVS